LRTPASVATVTDKSEPAMTTNKIADSDRPNHKSASGSQQIDGSACKPVTIVPTDSRNVRERASARPSAMPNTSEMK
jgi:hypothetical protein